MNSLKKKFAKFAVSTEIASKVSGGHMALDPLCDDCGGGYPGGGNWTCWNTRGQRFSFDNADDAIDAFIGAMGSLDGCSNGD